MLRRTMSAAVVAATACLAAGVPGPAKAQSGDELVSGARPAADQPVALVADAVNYDSTTGVVTARGNVEVYYGERTLTADSITYDSRAERISASGNIILRDPSGTTVYADIADLDAKLRDGLVRGAKSVIGRQAKLSAVEARRVEERYNTLSKAVYSPCDVCAEEPTPLWRIRARRVIHDEEERVIHYENATFDLFGVPVAWLPYFSHPDPTVERISGFLVPTVRQSGNYGFGLKTPYYIVIDEQSDATVTPFVMTDEGLLGEFQYRRVFDTGELLFDGSLTNTDFTGERNFQGHVDTEGLFRLDELDEGLAWGWDVKTTSDDAYLRYFDFSDEDRLTSELFVRNYWRDGFYEARALYFQSLRDFEPAGQIPRVLPQLEARKEVPDPVLGGEFGLFTNTQTLFRNNGADTTRLSVGLDWERQEILPVGLVMRGFGQVRGDYFISEDVPGQGDETEVRLAPFAGVEARFPLIWETMESGSHVLEPIASFVVAPQGGNGPDIPNEDSQQVEFDETSLFDVNRFSGIDGFEEGSRATLGLRYERVTETGIRIDATLGRILRLDEADEFGSGTGLGGLRSDWVGAWQADLAPWFTVRQRMRVDDDFNINRNEVFGDFSYGRFDLGAGYAFLEADPASGTPDDREELSGFLGIQVAPEWRVSGYAQRDLEQSEFVEVGGALAYQNECCAVDLFVRRRFTDSEDTPASTSFGVQVRLLTLGTDRDLAETDALPRFTAPRPSRVFAQSGSDS